MTKKLTFIVGVGPSCIGELWSDAARRSDALTLMEANGRGLWGVARLDIEILATSLVCMRLDLQAPVGHAQSYRLNQPEDYPPVVVVPPVLDPKEWPPEFGSAVGLPAPEGPAEIISRSTGYSVVLYVWRKVLAEVARVVEDLPQGEIRAGFHCDAIGYWGHREEEDIRGFEVAYGEFVDSLRRAGVEVVRTR